ncbi:MAG: hypothetical protein AAFQ66_16910 [Pseudomonadota bacterium]
MAEEWNLTYWNSERQCAYFALKDLAKKLPHTDANADEHTEWGTIIFRWSGEHRVGNRYGYTPLSKSKTANRWDPDKCSVQVPSWAERWAYCHSHPDGGYFSTWDTAVARGEQGGFFPMKCTMYMVNKKGAYWYDGRLGATVYHGRDDYNPRDPLHYGEFVGFWTN